jgi:predicted transcriptional regulator
MNSAIERLLTLRVSDIMTRNVVAIDAKQTMAQAAGILTQNFISGAPVTGLQGECVGILSAIDFVRCVTNAHEETPGSAGNLRQASVTKEPHACPAPTTDLVSSHMSAVVQAIGVNRPLTEAARVMCHNHIHRLVALDADGRPAGVLTALDIVAALINAIEE